MILILGFTLSFALAACGDGNPIGPSNQPEVGNNPDNFQFQASNLVRTTQTLIYTWTNTASVANVDQSGRIDSGEATLSLRDASGQEVYGRTLTSTGTFKSSSGTAGSWRLEVRLTGVTGTLNFRVQRGT
jgi:hypothetical protein